MTEAENAACGRQLLADQARGVSEMLKNLALEQSKPLNIAANKEKSFTVALAKAGILVGETLIYGDDHSPVLSLVTFGGVDSAKLSKVASAHFGIQLSVSEKLTLGKDKYCFLLKRKPRYDAAFGVAHLVKSGERKSGDTHSALRIDEKKFLIALSDGMGSGEYASLISERTVSLLESFYRAKMPPPLILSTVNKLLTFSKEESFACVDIAVIDLDEGKADIVKIGSPMSFILSEKSLKILESDSLPLGILDGIHPSVSTYPLQENDTLLFLSDGITDAFSSSGELYDYLKTVPASNPQRLAEELLSTALNRYGGIAKDDMTALAVRIFRAI
jgi:stage II sporulation protein E